jgi:hypothetical protein
LIEDAFRIDKTQPAAVQPELEIARSLLGVVLSWPTSIPAYSLQHAPSVGTNHAWQNTPDTVSRAGRRNVVNAGLEGDRKFFRLRANP